jgi:hypothetical protein
MTAYSTLLRPLLFRLDPEAAHHLAIAAGAHLGWAGPAMRMATRVDDDSLATEVAGLHFPTPIGLAAGFDKSGTAIPALAGLGFGAIEIGSVSIDASSGNPKPRLWRIPADDAIVVHYGLPNDGVEVIAKRLASIRVPVPLGVNLVVTNRGPGAPPLKADQIIGEYVAAAKRMAPHASYLMLNLSCPNTVDGRDFFADFGHLDACLIALGETGLRLPVFSESVAARRNRGDRSRARSRRRTRLRFRLHVQPAAGQAGRYAHLARAVARDARRGVRSTLVAACGPLHSRDIPPDGSQTPRPDRCRRHLLGRGRLPKTPLGLLAGAAPHRADLSGPGRRAHDHGWPRAATGA